MSVGRHQISDIRTSGVVTKAISDRVVCASRNSEEYRRTLTAYLLDFSLIRYYIESYKHGRKGLSP